MKASLFVLAFAAATQYEGSFAQTTMCDWCEAGDATCVKDGAVTKGSFRTSITDLVGNRSFPYFYPSGQSSLGESAYDAEVAVIVHHGAARNGVSQHTKTHTHNTHITHQARTHIRTHTCVLVTLRPRAPSHTSTPARSYRTITPRT